MKDKIRYLQIILLIGLMISAPAIAEWKTYCDKDELTDKVSGGISTSSLPDNPSSKLSPILLSYDDMPYNGRRSVSEFHIYNSRGFPSSEVDVECSTSGCRNQMYLTSKFNKDTKARTLHFFTSDFKNDKLFTLTTVLSQSNGFKKRIKENDNLKIRIDGKIHTFLLDGLGDAIKELRSSCDGVKGVFYLRV